MITKELAKHNKLAKDYGALIVRETLGESAVVLGSAAERAGLHEFDLILEAKGEKINDKNSLSDILQKCEIGEEIELKVLRGKQELKLKVKLEERK